MHELPLLIFTLCLQGSVGVTVWLALGPPVRRRGTRACTRRASRDGGGRLYWPA
ncbi:dimethyl sulfoxide reductase subunit C [Salmonella enterica subsp. enterica]|nr:dimethyl sulfoxide reductase subunit C [Salmonella enterica subsp. enterica]